MSTLRRFVPAALLLVAACAPTPDFSVRDGRVRELLPGHTTTVAYATLRNHTNAPLTITRVYGDAARAIEIHDHEHRPDGTVRMVRRTTLTLPPAIDVPLETGGLHLMLFDTQLPASDITLHFETAAGTVQSGTFRRISLGADG